MLLSSVFGSIPILTCTPASLARKVFVVRYYYIITYYYDVVTFLVHISG
jgi:hypothetical protein